MFLAYKFMYKNKSICLNTYANTAVLELVFNFGQLFVDGAYAIIAHRTEFKNRRRACQKPNDFHGRFLGIRGPPFLILFLVQ